MTLDAFLTHLPGVTADGNGYSAVCPVHDDHKPSLAIAEGDDGRILLKCRVGCKTADVLAKLGLQLRDLFPERTAERREVAVYDYIDADGRLRDQKVRFVPKSFAWRQGSNRSVPTLNGRRSASEAASRTN